MIIREMLGPMFGSHLQSCPSAAKSRQQACQKGRDAKQIVPLPLHSLDISSSYSSTMAFSEPSGRLGTVGLFRAQKMTPEGSNFNSGQLTCSFPCVLRFWRLYLCVPIAHNITKELMGGASSSLLSIYFNLILRSMQRASALESFGTHCM